jgi:hypothetical protein
VNNAYDGVGRSSSHNAPCCIVALVLGVLILILLNLEFDAKSVIWLQKSSIEGAISRDANADAPMPFPMPLFTSAPDPTTTEPIILHQSFLQYSKQLQANVDGVDFSGTFSLSAIGNCGKFS